MADTSALRETSDPTNGKGLSRDPGFDLARGFGILTVLVHHWTSSAARLYTVPKGLNWWMLSLLNRATTYSVPLFLLVSCVLAARSLEKNRDPIRFYRSRLPGVIHPYLVWTAIFWILTLASSPATRHLHAGVPEFFTHPMARLNDLVWGKAAFHLYFMVVLSQTILFLPCLFWKPLRELISRLSSGNNNSSWGLFIALWLLFQVMVQALQHFVLKLPYPASTFLWYSSAWWLALLIAAQWPRLGGLSIPKSTYLTVGLGVGAIYFGGAFQSLLGKSPFYLLGTRDWFSENFVLAVYCGFIATLVLRVARLSIQPAQLAHIPWLEWLGKNSLQIYLVHVVFLELLAKGFIVSLLARTHLGPALELALMAGLTYGAIRAFKAFNLERALFGRAT